MGPAPMIRMVEMSVLLGIKSRGQGIGHKKRARIPRVPLKNSARLPSRAAVFRPDSATAKGFYRLHQPAFWAVYACGGSSAQNRGEWRAPPAFALRAMAGQPSSHRLASRICGAAKAGGPAWI